MNGDENNTASLTLATGGNVNQSLTNCNIVTGDQIQRQNNKIIVYQQTIINPPICSSKQIAENLSAAAAWPMPIDVFDSEQSTPALAEIPENVERNLPNKKIKVAGRKSRLCDPSTPEEFEEYARKGAPSAVEYSLKPHEIMGNIEKLVHDNNVVEAETERDRLFQQIQYQSHPSAKHFKNMIGLIPGKNPVRKVLLNAAWAWKFTRETPKPEDRVRRLGRLQYDFRMLIGPLTGDVEWAENVLDHSFLNNGAHAFDVATFIASMTVVLYKIGFADHKPRCPHSSKSYAMKWIGISLRETKRYNEAIEFLETYKCDYDDDRDSNAIDIYETLGQCYEALQDFDTALQNLQKAKKLLLMHGYFKDPEDKLLILNNIIESVQKVSGLQVPPLDITPYWLDPWRNYRKRLL